MNELDRAVLDLEGRFWKYQGAKEAAIRDQLGLSAVRYYQVLARLIDDPAALAYAPMTVNRLRRAARASRPRRSAPVG